MTGFVVGSGRKACITSVALETINVNIIIIITRLHRRFPMVTLVFVAGVGNFERVGNPGGVGGIGLGGF